MKKIVAEDILKYFDNEIKKESFIPNIKSNIDKSKINIIYPLIGKLHMHIFIMIIYLKNLYMNYQNQKYPMKKEY